MGALEAEKFLSKKKLVRSIFNHSNYSFVNFTINPASLLLSTTKPESHCNSNFLFFYSPHALKKSSHKAYFQFF